MIGLKSLPPRRCLLQWGSPSSFDALYHEVDKKLFEAKSKGGNAIGY